MTRYNRLKIGMDDVGSNRGAGVMTGLSRLHPCRFSSLIQACFPIKIDEVWIDRFCVLYQCPQCLGSAMPFTHFLRQHWLSFTQRLAYLRQRCWIIHKQRVTPQDYPLCMEQRAVNGELWQRWPGCSLTTRCLRYTTRCELHNALHMKCNALLTLSNALRKISNALSSLITRYVMNQWIPFISVTWTTKCYLIGQYTYALLLLGKAQLN